MSSENQNNSKNKKLDEDKVEDNTYSTCYCQNLAIIILILLTLTFMLIVEVFRLYAIGHNVYFHDFYLYLYIVFFFVLVSILVIVVVLLWKPREIQRKYLKWLLLAISITFLLIALWVLVYIKFIYSQSDNFVYVNGIDLKNQRHENKSSDSNDHDHGYTDDRGHYHKDDDYHD